MSKLIEPIKIKTTAIMTFFIAKWQKLGNLSLFFSQNTNVGN